MNPYDVHAYCTIRIKIPGVMAESPEKAMAVAMEDGKVAEEISRLIDQEGMAGPVETIEYQDGELPVAHQIDEADPGRRAANPSGWSYRTDRNGRSVRVRHLMPTAYQDAVLEAFAGAGVIVAEDDIDAAARRLELRGHAEAAMLMRRLGSVTDRTEAVKAVRSIRTSLDGVIERLGACAPRLELGPEYTKG